MITTNIIQRVLFVGYKGKIGTSFTIEKNNRQYLISAKHIFHNINDSDEIEIYNDNLWKKISIKTHFCKDKDVDIIAFSFEKNESITPRYDIDLGLGGTMIGQDAYFLGFPYGLLTDSGEINNKYPFAFVKKCIISAVDKHLIYLDGHNNRGFSGGPLVIADNNKIKIIGVVSGFIGDNVNKDENSGIFYANNISLITDNL